MKINKISSNFCVPRQANIMANKNDLLYLFDRPTEPIFIGKGDDNATFEIPAEYLVRRVYICIFIIKFDVMI